MNSTSTSAGSTFYCHACAGNLGLLNRLHLIGSSPSTYQTAKAAKHAGPTSTSTGVNSVLNSGSTAEQDYLARMALQEGFIEVEATGCRSLVYQTTCHIGTRYEATSPTLELDSFRWVLSTSYSLAHGYAESSTRYSDVTCAACGSAVTS